MDYLIPCYTDNETVADFFDKLCDYARHFGDEQYHQLVHWSISCIEKYGENTHLSSLSEDIINDFEKEKIELVARIYVNKKFVRQYNRWFLSELELSPKHPKYEVFPSMLDEYNDEFSGILSEFDIAKRTLMKLAWNGTKTISNLASKLLSKSDREELEDWHAFRVVSMVYCVRN